MKISDAESQVMEALWRGKPLTPEEIVAEVGPANGWADGTVRTLVHRLLRKKAIAGKKEKTGYLYRPLISRADYVAEESQGFLDRIFDGEFAPMVAHLAEHRQLTPKDIRKLKALIKELEKDDE
ncbi:MAG TPA: BlaI/MecI/CopY family transcriptional regulator [Hyphomonadaceae bacterium]|nr:BlaI/MecI/CopY family transcriptional regulator [Hyphomonadaceae bacterium]